MNRFQKMIRACVIGIVANVLLAMMAPTAMAQVQLDRVKIPADTRLYLQTLENGDMEMRARSVDKVSTRQEAQLFVSCDPDADTKAIEAQLKAIGVKPQGTIGRYIMISTPLEAVNKIADIEGVTFRMKDDRLFIEGAENGTPIRIYTIDGRLVTSAPLTEGSVSLPIGSPAAVYAVQVGTLGSTLIPVQ